MPAYEEFRRLGTFVSLVETSPEGSAPNLAQAFDTLVDELINDKSPQGLRERLAVILDAEIVERGSVFADLLRSVMDDLK